MRKLKHTLIMLRSSDITNKINLTLTQQSIATADHTEESAHAQKYYPPQKIINVKLEEKLSHFEQI